LCNKRKWKRSLLVLDKINQIVKRVSEKQLGMEKRYEII
jgi:hypothetical protein